MVPSHFSQQFFQAPTSPGGMWGVGTSQRDGKKKYLPVQWLHVLYLMAIIHTDWQRQALPLHLSTACQHLLSQVNFTDPTSMRQCCPRCRAKACENPQGLLLPHFFQDALNSSNSRNGCRRLPAVCLSSVDSFFSSSGMRCQKEGAWQSKLSSATDYIASV